MLYSVEFFLFAVAAFIAVVNFYLSFVRALIYGWLGWECRNVSGIPLLGSLFLIAALLCVERTAPVWLLAIALISLDTGGLGWFLLIILYLTKKTF